jgi:hypothetical protein
MKILLDHCVPRPFRHSLPDHEVWHTSHIGLGQLRNGELLEEAKRRGFDLMLTVDKNIRHQHRLDALPLPVIELNLPRPVLAELERVATTIKEAIERSGDFLFAAVEAGGVVTIVQARDVD